MKGDALKRQTDNLIFCAKSAWPKTYRTTLWLLKIMLPVSFVVLFLQYFGVLDFLAQYLNPVFRYIGLPGASAIVFITGATVTTYASIAVMMTVHLTLREATIVSIMICLCHALPVECAVTHKTGSSFFGMMILRIAMAFAAAFYLNWVLPAYSQPFAFSMPVSASPTLPALLSGWCVSSVKLILMMLFIIYVLMVIQQMLVTYHLIRPISRPLEPLMRVFGLPRHTAYLWVVGNVLGISYGSAVMNDLLGSGEISKDEANEMNYHLSMNHSLLEDTSVFGAIGIGIGWIISTRLLFALIVVWSRRLFKSVRFVFH